MDLRAVLGHAGTLAVATLVAVVVLGALFGQPLLVSFVDSGSMRPGLAPGDGFVVIPSAFAGQIAPGDVVVYRAERLHGGGLVTHRVVGVSDRGFITKGDANAFTDQGGGEPPVKRAQVVGVALQRDGRVVAIPKLGAAVNGLSRTVRSVQTGLARLLGTNALLGTRGFAYLLFGASLVWYLLGAWRDRARTVRARNYDRETGQSTTLVLATSVAVIVVAATVGMAGPAGQTKYDVVSAHYDSAGPRVIPMGDSETTTHRMGNGGPVPVVVFLEPASQGIDVAPRELRIDGTSGANATVTLSAPPRTGHYRRYLVERRYFALLPRPTLRTLYALHPVAPMVAIEGLLAGLLYALGVAFTETGRLRRRSRDVPYRVRLRRTLRRLY